VPFASRDVLLTAKTEGFTTPFIASLTMVEKMKSPTSNYISFPSFFL
jgi:hypothetical protein